MSFPHHQLTDSTGRRSTWSVLMRLLFSVASVSFWLLAAAGTAWIIWSAWSFVEFGVLRHPFVQSKYLLSDVWHQLFLWALVPHLVAGCVCLLALTVQLLPVRYIQNRSRWHRMAGRVYVLTVLLVLCPTGFLMLPAVPLGVWNQLSFVTMGLGLFVTTWFAWRRIMQGDVAAHRHWMARSVAMATVAISFRALYGLLVMFEVDMATSYRVAAWLSIVLNAAVAEVWVRYTAAQLFIRPASERQASARPASGLCLQR